MKICMTHGRVGRLGRIGQLGRMGPVGQDRPDGQCNLALRASDLIKCSLIYHLPGQICVLHEVDFDDDPVQSLPP